MIKLEQLSLKSLRSALRASAKRLFAKFGYIPVAREGGPVPTFTDMDVIQSLVFETLMVGIQMDNPTKAEHMQDLARAVVFKLRKLESMSLADFIKNRQPPILSGRMIIYTIAAGIASFWEVHVKLLAQHIGIEIYEDFNRPNAKSPSIKDIEPIVDEIKKRLPNIEFNFGRLINLRNATVHGNFHQIRTVASESRKKNVRESYKGNVLQVDLSGISESKNLSSLTEFESIKKSGLFSWFLDVGNSELLESVVQEFQASVDLTMSVVSIKSLSFKETAGYFDQFCVRGEKLTAEQKEFFLETRKSVDQPKGSNIHYVNCIEEALKKDRK
jgi:hypothetical protein